MAQGRREFNYTPDYDSTVKMAETRGGGYDTVIKDNFKSLKPRAKQNLVRILPPTWEGPRHYGYGIWVHYNVGPNDRQYLCLRENATSPHRNCPVCEALYDLGTRATQDDRQRLRPKLSYIYYVIDRDAESEGVQVWRTSQKNTSEIAIQSIDRRNKAVLNITHPDKGYDVEFTRVGEGRNGTRYHGFMVMRESTPLSDRDRQYSDWLRYTEDHPLPECLNFYTPDYIEQVLHGRARDEDDEGGRRRGRGGDDEGEPRRLRRTRDPEDDYTRGEPGYGNGYDDELSPRRTREPDDEPPPRRTRDTEDEPRRPRGDGDDGRSPRRERDDPELTRAYSRGEDEPPRHRDPEDERPPRRTEPEEDRRPPSRQQEDEPRRGRGEDDRYQPRRGDPEDDRPSRRRDPEDDRRPPSRLNRDLDDEIPFDRNGGAREPEQEARPPRRQRERLNEPEDDRPPPRGARGDDRGGDRHEEARERVRRNLDRE